jgi:signal transduction histidine kinase/ActR/RegA family two-component response regulator
VTPAALLRMQPLSVESVRWRARALQIGARLIALVLLAGLPFYPTLAGKLEAGLRLALCLGMAQLARDPRWLRPCAIGFNLLLLELVARNLLTSGAAPGPEAALSATVLFGLVFLGRGAALLFYLLSIALPLAAWALIATRTIPVPTGYSFDTPGIWARSGANVLFFAMAIAYTVSALLREFEEQLAERGRALERLRQEQAGRAAAELRRDAAARALERAHQYELVGRLAASVAHDLSNMLVVVLSWTDLLDAPDSTAEDRAEASAAILTASERASALAQQLVSLGPVNADAGKPEPVELAALGAELVRTAGRLFNAPLTVREGKLEAAPALGVPSQLQRVLLNFALNARDAMPAGGAITISSGDATPEEAAGLEGPCVALRVADEGIGIDTQVRARLFEPFFSTKGDGQGLGLGLASALAVAQAHRGTIHVETAPAKGATFSLVLPKAVPAAPALEASTAAAPVAGRRVLLVEDEAVVRRVMARALRAGGFEVVEAADGASGIARVADAPGLDLLCVDGILPDLPSQRVIDAFAQRYPQGPVLICSGHVAAEALRARIEAGQYAFLAKPFAGPALAQTVGALLAKRTG